MTRIIPCLTLGAAMVFGGPQIFSTAVQELGGPQLQTGQALAQRLNRCEGHYRLVRRQVCTPVYGFRCEVRHGTRFCGRVVVRRNCTIRHFARNSCQGWQRGDKNPKIGTGG